jgi:Kdo2-lipid IVA lauroyltransferase/acyltransferase
MRRRLEAWAAGIVSVILRLTPRSTALALGAFLGRALAVLDKRHVAIAKDNLRRAFPDWDASRVDSTARAVYVHFGRMLFDVLWMQGRPSQEVLRFVDVEGRQHVEAALAAKRGVLYCTGHVGNWEVHAIALALAHGPISVLARPLDNPALDARLCAFRTSSGNAVIYKRKALSRIIRALRAGRGVAILLDQNVQAQDGIFVDFFGRPAATTTVAAALAAKTGCALIPAHSELMPDGRYRLIYDPQVPWTPSGDHAADVARTTQELARRTEEWIRGKPEQWLWMHRRWKTRPADEADDDRPNAEGGS